MTRAIKIGEVTIGGGNPIVIQSMTNTRTVDVETTVRQIIQLQMVGCEIVRLAVPDLESAVALKQIKSRVSIPLVADIHYDYKLAIESIKNGADKVRINPGNIGSKWKVQELAKVAREFQVPIRVGANSGSIPRDFEHLDFASALAEAALREVRYLEEVGFENIVVSVKSSDVLETIKANEYIATKIDYPIHLGVTEAGTYEMAVIKSSAAMGYLLLKGIGDTVRISIAGDPTTEVIVAKKLLIALHLRKGGQVIACPTCARSEINVEEIAKRIEPLVEQTNLTVAVMGCVVNGIGEGKHADIGVAGTKTGIVVFKKGKILKTVSHQSLEEELKELIRSMTQINS